MSLSNVEKDYDSLSLTLVADFDASVEHHDLTPGGEVTYFMTGPGGERIRGWWRVTAVAPPESLEFTDGFADQHGTPIESPVTAVKVRLTEYEGGTRMVLRFRFQSREHMEQLERRGAFDVFPQSVGQIDALLTNDGGS